MSCLVLANPINNEPLLEQLIGRIKRKSPNKQKPIVADIALSGTTGKNQERARRGFYLKEGYDVIEI